GAASTGGAGGGRPGGGRTLVGLVCMRICGPAHHADMLYLGKDRAISWDYPPLAEGGYADRDLFAFWFRRDPIATYAARLSAEGLLGEGDLDRFRKETEQLVEAQARLVIDAPWPDPALAGAGVVSGETPRSRIEPLEPERRRSASFPAPPLEPGPPFDPKGQTLLEGVMLGVGDALRSDPRVFVYGEDVGGRYGNAFLLLRPLLPEFGDRIVNSPLSEAAVVGVCVG